MHYKHEHRPESIIQWDKGDPDCKGLQDAFEHYISIDHENTPIVIPIDTNRESLVAVMVAPYGFTKEIAQLEYKHRDIFFNQQN